MLRGGGARHGRDRKQLERLFALCAGRGPLSDQLELFADDKAPRRKRWAWLPQRAFRADLDTCPNCGGPMLDDGDGNGLTNLEEWIYGL